MTQSPDYYTQNAYACQQIFRALYVLFEKSPAAYSLQIRRFPVYLTPVMDNEGTDYTEK